MRYLRVLFAGLACLLAAPALAAPLEAYGQLPLIEDLALSADGTMIAITMTDGENRKVLVRRVDSEAGAQFVSIGDAKIRDVRWIDPDHLLIVHSVIRTKAYLGPALEANLAMLYVASTRKLSPWEGFTWSKVDRPEQWPYDDKGRPTAFVTYRDLTGTWTIQAKDGYSHWSEVAKGEHPFGPPRIVARGSSDDAILVLLDTPAGGVVRELNLKTGKWSADLPYPPNAGVMVNRKGEVVAVRSTVGDEEQVYFTSKSDQAIWESLKKSFPKDDIKIASWSDDHRTIVVELNSRTATPGYVLVDMNTKKASFIANKYGGITSKDIGLIKPIKYKAADGLEIPAYLTLPPGREAKGLPLVVLPHGGPAVRDSLGFDWWAQALASRGYAVLQPNFRGSSGYGAAFMEAGYGQFGRKMQTDLSDGVRYLAAQGVIDPKRVCIMGASYGGYAALAGAAFDRGVYRCAASVAGPSDLPKMLSPDGNGQPNSGVRCWTNFIGADNLRDKTLVEFSPARHAENIDIPILLIHGKDDGVVGYEQSRFMAQALQKAGKPVEFVTLDGEDHHLSRGETRLRMLQSLVAFVEKNNPPN